MPAFWASADTLTSSRPRSHTCRYPTSGSSAGPARSTRQRVGSPGCARSRRPPSHRPRLVEGNTLGVRADVAPRPVVRVERHADFAGCVFREYELQVRVLRPDGSILLDQVPLRRRPVHEFHPQRAAVEPELSQRCNRTGTSPDVHELLGTAEILRKNSIEASPIACPNSCRMTASSTHPRFKVGSSSGTSARSPRTLGPWGRASGSPWLRCRSQSRTLGRRRA